MGGGIRGHRMRKSAIKGWGKNFPDRMLSDIKVIREEVPDFDPALEFDYTRRELMLLAEKILLQDPKAGHEHPAILNANRYRHRSLHEIYTADGVPDPAYVSGLYWRTHPEGRRWRTQERMAATGAGFYHD